MLIYFAFDELKEKSYYYNLISLSYRNINSHVGSARDLEISVDSGCPTNSEKTKITMVKY